MKKVNCYICDSKESKTLFKQQGNDSYIKYVFDKEPENLLWKICLDCGLVYRSPVLEEKELNILYKNYDQTVLKNEVSNDYFQKIVNIPKNESENWQKSEWVYNQIKNRIPSHDNIEVLDVGCGGGTLLFSFNEFFKNIKLHGVELNSTYANIAKKNLEINVIEKHYKSGLFDKKFDLLVNTKVLEHISDPIPFLKEIYSDLKDTGFLFIEVPDVSDMFILPADDERFFIPHIYFFSEYTLSNLLQISGFSIFSKRINKTHRNRSYLQIIAQKEEKTNKSDELIISKKEILKTMNKILLNMYQFQ